MHCQVEIEEKIIKFIDSLKYFLALGSIIAANLVLDFAAEWYMLLGKELIDMPIIKSISDLNTEVPHGVDVGAPVFLTKNGRGRYAIVDMKDNEKMQATLRLMNELAKGRRSGEQEGWLSPDDMRAHFRAKANKIHYSVEVRCDLDDI